MIRIFSKDVRNQCLGDNLNNFICEELIWMTFTCASISIRLGYCMFLFKGLISIPILWIEIFYSFNLHANLCQYISNQIIVHIFILSECYN